MSRFNTTTVVERPDTENLAGGEAYTATPKLALINLLLSSFTTNQHYRSGDEQVEELVKLIEANDKKYAAKAALVARNKFGMRSVTHVSAAEISRLVSGEEWVKFFLASVFRRPDDITETLAYYIGKYGKPIPNSLKKGIALALPKFSEYQLAKYRGEGKSVSLVDAVNLTHPIPTDAISKLMVGNLKSEDTWEVRLSAAGNDENAKAKVWFDLISEKKLGYFALLRNLRNILTQADDKTVDLACEALVNETAIEKSLVMPFRFNSAIDALKEHYAEAPSSTKTRKVIQSLSDATDISLKNVPQLAGSTLIAMDCSGSMEGRPIQIASMFTAALAKANPNADVMRFSTDAEYLLVNPADSTMGIANYLLHDLDMCGTNFNSIFEKANKAYDRIVILSDMQAWDGYYVPTESAKNYRSTFNCDPHIFSWDLQGYGSLQFPENKVYALAGFNDKAFQIMETLEADKNALINSIESVAL